MCVHAYSIWSVNAITHYGMQHVCFWLCTALLSVCLCMFSGLKSIQCLIMQVQNGLTNFFFRTSIITHHVVFVSSSLHVFPLPWCVTLWLVHCLPPSPTSFSLTPLSGWSAAHLVKTGLIDYRIVWAIKLAQSSMPSLFSLPLAPSPRWKMYSTGSFCQQGTCACCWNCF